MKNFLLWFAGIILVFYFIGKCNNNDTSRDEILTDTAAIISSVDTSEVAPATGWSYSEDEDKMTSKTTYYASVDASELLYFKSPYDGGSTATLTVRNKGGKNEVIFQVSKGQLLTRSYESTSYRVRFDDNAAIRYPFIGPSDGSSSVAFIHDSSVFIRNLKKSKKVILEIEFYREGNKQIEFNVSDFKWNH